MGSYRDNLIAAMVVFLVINTAAISARLYVRVKLLTRAIGMDDFMLCLVFVSSAVGCCFLRIEARLHKIPGTLI